MKIAIVNNTTTTVETLKRILAANSDYKIAWVATDGVQAVAKAAVDTPDLILMNLEIPFIDGVEATRQIMAKSPCAILIVTSDLKGHSSRVFEAMRYGAVDAINLAKSGNTADNTQILAKIATIAKLIGKSSRNPKPRISTKALPLLAIGSSTGGPPALATLLSGLPKNLSAAVAIVQHVDIQFASGFAEWLNNQSPLPVKLAIAGEYLQPGQVTIAATNDHLVLSPTLTIKYTEEPRDFPYRPSVDVFFKSVAQHWQCKGVGIVLTGMGRDGGEGLLALRSIGWHTIAQDQATSAVYGMPKAAAELKAAVEILPIQAIASACIKQLSGLETR